MKRLSTAVRAAIGAAPAIGVCSFAVACGGGGGSVTSASVQSHARSSDKWATAARVVVEGAGRIIAARRVGAISHSGTLFAVSRFTRDGKPDPSFCTGGTAVADFGSKFGAGAEAVALQRDGKIVVFGWSASLPPDPAEGVGPVGVIARFLPDGRLDTGFGIGGKVVPRLKGGFSAGAIRPDGRIVALASPATGRMGDSTGASATVAQQ